MTRAFIFSKLMAALCLISACSHVNLSRATIVGADAREMLNNSAAALLAVNAASGQNSSGSALLVSVMADSPIKHLSRYYYTGDVHGCLGALSLFSTGAATAACQRSQQGANAETIFSACLLLPLIFANDCALHPVDEDGFFILESRDKP